MTNPVRHVALKVAYQGTAYAGWQVQANAPTVQGMLEAGLERLIKVPITVRGCSRTDAGVHARGHMSSFRSTTSIPCAKLPLALGTVLPSDIVVLEAWDVVDTFDARHSTRGKMYEYRIWNHPRPDPFERPFSYHEPRPLNVRAMQRAARDLKGRADYRTFRAAGFESATSVRTLYDCYVAQEGPRITMRIRGDAFLYNMVRIIAGTLLYIGLGMIDPTSIPEIIASGDRTRAGKTLGPQGLFLDRVYYPQALFHTADEG